MQAFSDTGRILINTTIGVLGLIDVASQTGFEKHNEDFGQTLGYWGVGSGPYIVLPLFGSSTLRDSVGLLADSRPSRLRQVKHIRSRNQIFLTKVVNRRAQLLDQEKVMEEAALDRYEFTRDTYLLHRNSLVYDGNPPREKYDDEEAVKSPESKPTPPTPHTQSESVLRTANITRQPSFAEAKFDNERPSVNKLWLAQRSGIR